MPLEPCHGASLSSKLRNILDFPCVAGLRLATVLLFGCGAVMLAQQQPQPPAQIPPPTEPAPQQTPAPTSAPPEIAPDDPDNGQPFEAYIWKTSGSTRLLPGVQTYTNTVTGINYQAAIGPTLPLPNYSSLSPAGMVSMPAGKFNHLEISYFQADGSGTYTTPVALSIFGEAFGPGTLMSNTYRVRNVQLTWNYLTWPSPPEDSKFRLRTLYGFNYTRVNAVLDAPLDTNPNFAPGTGSKQIFYPAFGIAAEYIPSKHLFFEARAWGFAIPQHADIGDVEGHLVGHVGHFEIFLGYKMFHFKTSKNSDEYFLGTVSGPTAGVRWLFR